MLEFVYNSTVKTWINVRVANGFLWGHRKRKKKYFLKGR